MGVGALHPIGSEGCRGRPLPSWSGASFRDLGKGSGFHLGVSRSDRLTVTQWVAVGWRSVSGAAVCTKLRRLQERSKTSLHTFFLIPLQNLSVLKSADFRGDQKCLATSRNCAAEPMCAKRFSTVLVKPDRVGFCSGISF